MNEIEIITPRVDHRERAKRDIQEKIVGLIRHGVTRRSAAMAGGIDKATFYRWMKADATFATQVEVAEAESVALMEAQLYAQSAKATEDWRAKIEWLKRRNRDDWDEKRPIDLSTLSDEQIIRIFQKIDDRGVISQEDYHDALTEG
jgi:hypothetical protein